MEAEEAIFSQGSVFRVWGGWAEAQAKLLWSPGAKSAQDEESVLDFSVSVDHHNRLPWDHKGETQGIRGNTPSTEVGSVEGSWE